MTKFCECGCNQRVKPSKRFIVGHHVRLWDRKAMGLGKKISQALKKHKRTSLHISHIVEARKRNGTYKLSETRKKQISLQLKGNAYTLDRVTPPEERLKKSEANKKFWKIHPDFTITKNNGKKKFSYIGENEEIYHMRSTWEIKYANYLDSKNILWQYESKQFHLSNGKRYCPDFFLPELNEYHEIKGYLSNTAHEKITLFKAEYPNIMFKILDKPILQQIGVLK